MMALQVNVDLYIAMMSNGIVPLTLSILQI